MTASRGIASWASHQPLGSLKRGLAALVNSGGMVGQREDASPAATEGLAAPAGGNRANKVVIPTCLVGGWKCWQSGTAQLGRRLGRAVKVQRSRGLGLATQNGRRGIEWAPLSPRLPRRWLRRWEPIVIGSVVAHGLNGTGSSVSDTQERARTWKGLRINWIK